MKTMIIAFCGIDGSGKTSLISRLREKQKLDNATYQKKLNQRNLRLVEMYHNRRFNSGEDWVDSEFAQSAAVATCLDFMEHYDANIESNIGKRKYIICDRYMLCYEAYLRATKSRFDVKGIFDAIVVPDLLFYIDVPVEVAVARHHERGGPKEDEHPLVMEKFRQAYMDLLRINYSDAIIIDNTRSFDDVYQQIVKQIRHRLCLC